MKTEDKIVAKALEMFNENGIEYVGVRELAALLNMRVSNITYYFPTKDDLVYRISQDLATLNSQTIFVDSTLTLYGFLHRFRQIFANQYQYRCLLLSSVHIKLQNKHFAESYNKTQKKRTADLKANLELLKTSRFLKMDADVDFLISSMGLFARFWLSEVAISYNNMSQHQQQKHYINLMVKLILPYTTAKGKKEIERFLEEV